MKKAFGFHFVFVFVVFISFRLATVSPSTCIQLELINRNCIKLIPPILQFDVELDIELTLDLGLALGSE